MALSNSREDQDVVAIAVSENLSCAQVFFIRGGKLIGRERFIIQSDENTEPAEILNSFIKQFYNAVEFIPNEIIIQHKIDDIELITAWLSQKTGHKVQIKAPQRGEKLKLIKMVEQNAEISLKREIEINNRGLSSAKQGLGELVKMLGLDDIPERIEAYDISNTGQSEIVGSMVVFEFGAANNKEYRRFRIKSIAAQDDYRSMQEVLFRRFNHARADFSSESKTGSFSKMPDLILIDGGKGHVNAVQKVLTEAGIETPVFGMVKDEKHKARGLVSVDGEVNLKHNMILLRFITAIQDEAHRFAIGYNRKLRDKRYKVSVLDEIAGIGPERKKALLKHFGSPEKIKNARIDEIEAVDGINRKIAEKIHEYFRK
jgi:excinuclease ABC subunit C